VTKFDFSHLAGHKLIYDPAANRTATAFHEAGHATIATVLDVPVEYATIEIPATYTNALAGLTKLKGDFGDDSEKALAYYVAGILAEIRGRTSQINPPEHTVILEEAYCRGDRDLEFILDELNLLKMVGEEPPEHFAEFSASLLHRYWLLVEKVAARLVDVGTIYGEEIERLRRELF
jgi:hypothetical protein